MVRAPSAAIDGLPLAAVLILDSGRRSMAQSSSSGRRRFARVAGLAVASILVAATPAAAADGQILRENSPDAIPESYIVVLDQDASPEAERSRVINSLSQEHDAQVEHKYTNSVKGFSAEMT